MIKAAIAKSRRICWNWHQRGVVADLSLHIADGTPQSRAKRLSECRKVVELQCAHHLTKAPLVGTNPCTGTAAGRCCAALETPIGSQAELAATLGAHESPLHTARAAAQWGEDSQHWRKGEVQLSHCIAGSLNELHRPTIVRRAYRQRIGRYDGRMTSTTKTWSVRTLPLVELPASDWNQLLATNPTASAFSNRAVHEAWWIGYGSEATDISLAVYDEQNSLAAYLPLMLRPDGVRYLGATYHIDYATVLLDLGDAERSASALEALVAHLYADTAGLDLRRLRRADQAHEMLIQALTKSGTRGATLTVEDPAPAIDLTNVTTFDAHLERIDKKDRHEIRRKVRRGEGAGVTISSASHPIDDLAEFIKLHRARWGHHGLFTEDARGARDETFMRELFARAPDDLITLTVARNQEFGAFAAGLFLRDATGLRYWNAGGELTARSLSPGILLFVHGLQMAIAERRESFDFLRGNESYKYEVGAVDVDVLMISVPAS